MKKILIPFFIAAIFAVVFGGSYFLGKVSKALVKKENPQESAQSVTALPLEENQEKVLSILLLGYGGPGHDGGTLSDTLILLYANLETKKVTLISIPRDLWVPIPYDWDNTAFYKINMAYAMGLDDVRYPNKKPEFRKEAGGGNLAKEVVGKVTGITAQNFVSVNFEGLTKIIDILGGVEVDVPKTFNDYFYPVKGKENETCGINASEIAEFHLKYSGFELEKQFTCRYENLHFDKGSQVMNGETALKFVRSRHSSEHGGDFARSERQSALLTGIKDKAISFQALGKLNSILDKVTKNVRTDLTPTQIQRLFDTLEKHSEYEITNIHLSEDNVLRATTGASGQFILVPKDGTNNFSGIQKFIFQQMP